MKRTLLIATGALSFLLGVCTTPQARSQETSPSRFDQKVRNDFFAGIMGNREAFERAMSTTRKVMAEQPEHAEAMVWLGVGEFFLAGQAFAAGDSQKGTALWTQSLARMDRAVELAPDNVGVRIPRGAPLLSASREVPPDMREPLLRRALSDYQRVWDLQRDMLHQLGEHPRGELFMGLAEAYEGVGDTEKSRELLLRVTREMDGSEYARRAQAWLGGTLPPRQRNCIGCHVSGVTN